MVISYWESGIGNWPNRASGIGQTGNWASGIGQTGHWALAKQGIGQTGHRPNRALVGNSPPLSPSPP
ncbi:hypothetical protein, partial [Microcoleus anatoxicus]